MKSVEAHAPGARARDLLISAAPLCSTADGIVGGCVIAMVDLSQPKTARTSKFLMAELDHRVKNILTLVMSILYQTDEADIELFRTTFAGRIQALAAT
ncbi:MAG: HWE histidine kinase domain-containing protein [Methylocystis sp.]